MAIDMQLDNIHFPYSNEEKLRLLEQTFLKYCKGAFPGTVAAGDGIAFKTQKPSSADTDGAVRDFSTGKVFMPMLSKHLLMEMVNLCTCL